MPGRRARKGPQAKGQAGAAAKQLGLFIEFNPAEMILDLEDDDGDLEAELAAITGENLPTGKTKPKGKSPLPMGHIEKMAAECMKDMDDDDDEGLEEDTELLAELQEVLGEEHGEETREKDTETIETSPITTEHPTDMQTQMTPVVSSGLQKTVEDRIAIYKTAILNAKEAGENAKVRRYERGLKTLESMLTALKNGKKVNEEEIPPPVASGKSSLPVPLVTPHSDLPTSSTDQDEVTSPEEEGTESLSAANKLTDPSDQQLSVNRIAVQDHDVNTDALGTKATLESNSKHLDTRALLVTREKEYKLAALKAKQKGDLEKAKEYMRTGKKFSLVIEALDNGQPVDLRDMPPALEKLESPEDVQISSIQIPSVPAENCQLVTKPDFQGYEDPGSQQQPKTVLEALNQRLEKYKSAAAQAKANGDGRKSRMHERIAKQYQDAIKAHKAGRKVNFAELPVPPGFPPIPGISPIDGHGTVSGMLENANTLIKMEEEGERTDDKDHDDDDEGESSTEAPAAPKPTQLPTKPVQIVQPLVVQPTVIQEESPSEKDHSLPISGIRSEKSPSTEHLPSAAKEHLEFLESRKKQYLKAAIQAKKKNDLEQAKAYLRTAKSLDPKIEMAKNGKLVDISKLPSPPTDDEGDFIFIHHEDVRLSQKVEEVYIQLINLLKDQHEKCMQYSKQFMHLGNVTETSRFEKLAQHCKKDLEILQLAQKQGLDPPSHHFEERTFKIVRIFSDLSSTEMHLIIVRGINLPAPAGVAPNDLDAVVKFEFHYPNTEQVQKSKTSVVKNTNCPEYNQLFKLNINRNHRGFRRAIQTKGIKFEIFHKGSFFRSDKQVGAAHLKLDKLESECEIREIVEVLDSRKPTGGKLEVKVRLREPLTGQDLQTITENWLVLEH
ncbi:coiled-coil and C2 domain-containing protein 1B [Erythrolamprus reginae]|uniref:coiled-coil and C2 domain-containing protein 1B n=1 Tax=Erythrolamprus reginae TaxID=121349 RepID=UPI00396C9BDB